MEKRCRFQHEVAREQIEYSDVIVDDSIENHTVPDKFDEKNQKKI